MRIIPVTKRIWLPSPLLLFLLPSLLLIVVFFVVPISLTGIISLTSLDYRFRWDFVGLTNFLMLLQDTIIPRVLLNTGVYVFTTLLLFHLGLGLGLALLTATLPEIRPGITALSLFAFLSGWGEYVFLVTFILDKSGWTLSRYVASILGEGEVFVDYGLITAVGLFYMLPALVLFALAHKHLVRLPFGVGTR